MQSARNRVTNSYENTFCSSTPVSTYANTFVKNLHRRQLTQRNNYFCISIWALPESSNRVGERFLDKQSRGSRDSYGEEQMRESSAS